MQGVLALCSSQEINKHSQCCRAFVLPPADAEEAEPSPDPVNTCVESWVLLRTEPSYVVFNHPGSSLGTRPAMGSADDMRQASIRAQAVLDMLYGALQMAWKDPKVLQEAVAGLVATLEDTPTEMEQAFGLVQYLEAVLTPLQRLSSKKAFMVAQCRKKKRRRSNSKSPLVPRGNDDVDEVSGPPLFRFVFSSLSPYYHYLLLIQSTLVLNDK